MAKYEINTKYALRGLQRIKNRRIKDILNRPRNNWCRNISNIPRLSVISVQCSASVDHQGCNMNGFLNGGDVSMIMTATFMKLVGLWTANGIREQRARKFALIYTVAAMLFALWIEFTDFYYSFGDFSVSGGKRDYFWRERL